jgi:hypothetical protein
MLPGIPKSVSYVQRFDDSLNSAIRITYRISLRSSSIREPRYPLLRVVQEFHRIRFKRGMRASLERDSTAAELNVLHIMKDTKRK